jgi:uncharacterized membrane protein
LISCFSELPSPSCMLPVSSEPCWRARVGVAVGLIFGLPAVPCAAPPTGPIDVAFVNPLVSVLPRLLIGPAAWLVSRALRGSARPPGRELLAVSASVGSLANTVLS